MEESVRQEILSLVEELHQFRSQFFVGKDVFSLESKRDDAVNEKLKETLVTLDSFIAKLEDGKEKTILKCFARGKALNVKPDFDEEALELLSRAVKLNPLMADAWVELGNCFWKKGDLTSALNCFESARKIDGKHKECLRNLSIALRSMRTVEDKEGRLVKSLSLAKEAVEVDVTDGASWTILANAYLTMYCCSPKQDPSLLRQAHVSYSRAKDDPVESTQPDFMYNYANLLQLEEDFQGAIDLLTKVTVTEPDWKEPQERKDSIISTLKDVHLMVTKKSSMKVKRLENFASQLKLATDLPTRAKKILNDLKEGKNAGSFIHLKVIGSVRHNRNVSLTVCGMDSSCQCVAVSIFNLGQEPKIGDTLTIADPHFRLVSVKINDEEIISFPGIRVDNPLIILLNGRMIPPDFLAKPRIENVTKNT